MPAHRCPLCSPWARVGLVLAGGLLADAFLPLSGHRMASHDCGEHPWITLAGLGVLALHFNTDRLIRALTHRRTP